MWKKVLGIALTELFKLLKPETVKDFIDAGLDKLEEKYIDGEVDTTGEQALRSAIDFIRTVMQIDDNKYGTDKE